MRLTVLLIFISTFAGAPATAYASEQSAIDAYFAPWTRPKGMETLRHLARCVVERHPTSAQAFVREVGSDLEMRARSSEVLDPKCIKLFFFKNSTTQISPPTYLPLLAEFLLRKDYGAGQLPSFTGIPPLDHPALPDLPVASVHPRYRDAFTLDKALVRLEKAAECIARTVPERVLELAATEPDSSPEVNVLAGLYQAHPTCVAPSSQYSFPNFAKRGALIMNLYRLVDIARPVVQNEVSPDA
jgi:hypothetical protein